MIELTTLSDLIKKKNEIDNEIARIIHRPAQTGHVGEFIASIIFDIQLVESARQKAIDGYFRSGLQAGKSVNIKWYGKQEGILDITPIDLPDIYLVMTGQKTSSITSRGKLRPWCIEYIYIFLSSDLINWLSDRTVKIGTATSVSKYLWSQAEIYPKDCSPLLPLTLEQKDLIKMFNDVGMKGGQTS